MAELANVTAPTEANALPSRSGRPTTEILCPAKTFPKNEAPWVLINKRLRSFTGFHQKPYMASSTAEFRSPEVSLILQVNFGKFWPGHNYHKVKCQTFVVAYETDQRRVYKPTESTIFSSEKSYFPCRLKCPQHFQNGQAS